MREFGFASWHNDHMKTIQQTLFVSLNVLLIIVKRSVSCTYSATPYHLIVINDRTIIVVYMWRRKHNNDRTIIVLYMWTRKHNLPFFYLNKGCNLMYLKDILSNSVKLRND